ncbi:MAG: glycosyltransferase [Solirubrobacteraceae bacterium]
MSDYRPPNTTSGFLPAGAFVHEAPTAVGLLDLDAPFAVQSPDPDGACGGHRDALLLVRLHGDPLAVVHLERPVNELSTAAILERVWVAAESRIRDHLIRHGCGEAPRELRDMLDGPLPAHCTATDPAAVQTADAAVIVATGGRSAQLDRCIRSLLAMSQPPAAIVVVDNRPGTDNTRDVVQAWARVSPIVRYVAEPRPGSSVARNRGIAEVDAPIVAFTDDDVVVDREWLSNLIVPFADPTVLATTGLVMPLALETPAQKLFEKYAGFSKGVVGRAYDMGERRAGNRFLYPFWGAVFGSGNSMAFRRRELIAAGGFDPALGAGSVALAGADIDAMSNAVLNGTLVYEPRAICWHEHRRSEEAFRRQLYNYGAGLTAIFTKWLLHDTRFTRSAIESIPILIERKRGGPLAGTAAAPLPPHFARLERRGMRRGPLLYVRSLRWSRRLGLDRVLDGA